MPGLEPFLDEATGCCSRNGVLGPARMCPHSGPGSGAWQHRQVFIGTGKWFLVRESRTLVSKHIWELEFRRVTGQVMGAGISFLSDLVISALGCSQEVGNKLLRESPIAWDEGIRLPPGDTEAPVLDSREFVNFLKLCVYFCEKTPAGEDGWCSSIQRFWDT